MMSGMGRPERRRAMEPYVTGLLLDGDRKSTQPMAMRLAKEREDAEALRQRLQQCVSISSWSDAELMARLALKVDREMPDVNAFVVDDTGFPKKGTYSVGVARQYSGTQGRVDNCQVAVSLHLAGRTGSACIGMRLYLSEAWASDKKRRASVGIPADIEFRTKWKLSLAQIEAALKDGVRPHVVLADAGYGDATAFRNGLEALHLPYVVGVSGISTIWRPGVRPQARARGNVGRPPKRFVAAQPPVALHTFAKEQRPSAFKTVRWRAGTKGTMHARFFAARVYSAERRTKANCPKPTEQWVVIEATGEKTRPFKYFVSNLPAATSLKRLVSLIKLRWRVERDYQEMKQELGLDHFEGRSWRGFHHHATLCAVAHGFLALRRALSPPILQNDPMDPPYGAALP